MTGAGDERRLTPGERNEQRRQERRAAKRVEAGGDATQAGTTRDAGAAGRGSAGQRGVGARGGTAGQRTAGATWTPTGKPGASGKPGAGGKPGAAAKTKAGAGGKRGAAAKAGTGGKREPRAGGPVAPSETVKPLHGPGADTGEQAGVASPEGLPAARTESDRRVRTHKAAAPLATKDTTYRAGFACFVGRPNAGKSTLTNAIIGQKIAITSSKPQTTRHVIRAILHQEHAQLVLVDTPGLHRPRTLLGERLNDLVRDTWSEVDVIGICFPADEPVGAGDRFISAEMAELKATVIAVVTKVDLVGPALLAQRLLAVSNLYDFAEIVPVSAVSGHQVETLVDVITRHLPESP
ncbi:MAG: GTPase, partial [Actinoplanes sp.]|nr:GTPase [Actinoplanes sp.]